IVNYANGSITSPGDDVTANPTTLARTDLTTSHTYDSAGSRTSSTDPRRAVEAAVGTSLGPDDFVTRVTLDALNRQRTERTASTPGLTVTQKTSLNAYDELGHLRSETDFGGLIAATEFDRVGRALRTFEHPAGASGPSLTAVTAYDADGKPLTAKDRRQVADSSLGSTTYAYDGLGRQTAMTEAAGSAAEALTTTAYDALDRRTTYVVGGQDTRYGYDLGGRVTATDDGFTCTSEVFDYRDLATSTTDGKDGNGCAGTGQYTVTHTHDGLGRLILSVQGILRPLDDVFDSAGNRLRSAPVTDNGSGETTTSVTTFTVNGLDQVITQTRTESGTGRTSKTTYDAVGNAVDRCRWDAGATVGECLPPGSGGSSPPSHVSTTAYDARNQRIELTDGSTQQTTEYDPAHNYQPLAAYVPTGNGYELQTLYTYDSRHRLTEVFVRHCMVEGHTCITPPGDVLGHVMYEYDANHNRTVVRESGSGWADSLPGWFYCYDARNQLVARDTGAACSATSGDETYSYDDAGNRLSAAQDGVTETFSYDADGQYTGAVHDTVGRITEWDNWRFLGYDAEGRLTEVCDLACSSGSQRFYFTYDADGRRTKIVDAAGGVSTTTELRYTADGHISAEYTHTCDINGCSVPVLTREYVTAESGAIVKMTVPAEEPDAGTYLVSWNGHGDALNLIHVAKGRATLANSFTYDTWGDSGVTVHNGFGDLGFRFRYVGQFGVQDDTVHGLPLVLMGARHYSPDLGRFIQPDPARLEANHYAYAGDNPVTRADPSGTCWGVLSWIPVWTPWGLAWKAVCVSWWWAVGAGGVSAGTHVIRNFDNVNFAQNKRQAQKKIRSLEGQARKHEEKIRNCPKCPQVNHWRGEIRTLRGQVTRVKGRWGIR
ncbi:MAG: hypothetical protein M3406_14790, partial [Chloroflexota bacterium]|nr:hypothetical protein [Chloroflexota bacterium]